MTANTPNGHDPSGGGAPTLGDWTERTATDIEPGDRIRLPLWVQWPSARVTAVTRRDDGTWQVSLVWRETELPGVEAILGDSDPVLIAVDSPTRLRPVCPDSSSGRDNPFVLSRHGGYLGLQQIA